MRNIDAKIILASENPTGDKLVTAILRYPRWLHSEIMTHRAFSRNAASSRAIPVRKILDMVHDEPAMPEYWGGEKPGMQSGMALPESEAQDCANVWRRAAKSAVSYAQELLGAGLHKSLVNRLLEPWMPYTVLVSATSWDNFFALRAHEAAMPEFQILAYRMLDQYLKADFQKLAWGEWHIPFGDQMPEGLALGTQLKVSAARCARLSYLTHDGEMNVEKDLELYNRLMVAEPLHASPAEHPAMAESSLWINAGNEDGSGWNPLWGVEAMLDSHMMPEYSHNIRTSRGVSGVDQGNFRGFTQLRKMQPNECVHQADLKAIMSTKPDWITL